eukprot:9496606-Pyramimonas_sp.AAC.2
MKPLECFTTLPFDMCVEHLVRTQKQARQAMKRPAACLTERVPRRVPVKQSKIGWGNSKDAWITGTKGQLKSSQEYPKMFCLELAKQSHRWDRLHGSVRRPPSPTISVPTRGVIIPKGGCGNVARECVGNLMRSQIPRPPAGN